MRVNLCGKNRAPIHWNGLPMADVELRQISGDYVLVRAPGAEKDLRGKEVVRDRVVPLSEVAMIDYLEESS